MTTSDWLGLTITVAVFLGMFVAFVWALWPSKKKQLEDQKYKILEDE
ncbi:MAG: cbb3-type cytochrome c oxidase subunit 3 [Thiomicrospira sp.]|nr:cbb3-type cytochrome c oxidase subunit 3 [Thiomicrospira sp.]NCN67106.1 cbb3-type cytochrome c oxidase subunit 3 [Thiomicrospira sp.]NCO13034.1 cbb3-type cytochrome c oxidase subunit 3 [Thiomicrospira sp.]NCO81437.1 cbb3-type cytochrome c oxidase subunit 3 [Thiomicrospira sp.]NCP56626.1 cbb3-type cytochrome c oxidase subunit 3 [Thiomicrospira sp.]